jgi:hypothetical protein
LISLVAIPSQDPEDRRVCGEKSIRVDLVGQVELNPAQGWNLFCLTLYLLAGFSTETESVVDMGADA